MSLWPGHAGRKLQTITADTLQQCQVDCENNVPCNGITVSSLGECRLHSPSRPTDVSRFYYGPCAAKRADILSTDGVLVDGSAVDYQCWTYRYIPVVANTGTTTTVAPGQTTLEPDVFVNTSVVVISGGVAIDMGDNAAFIQLFQDNPTEVSVTLQSSIGASAGVDPSYVIIISVLSARRLEEDADQHQRRLTAAGVDVQYEIRVPETERSVTGETGVSLSASALTQTLTQELETAQEQGTLTVPASVAPSSVAITPPTVAVVYEVITTTTTTTTTSTTTTTVTTTTTTTLAGQQNPTPQTTTTTVAGGGDSEVDVRSSSSDNEDENILVLVSIFLGGMVGLAGLVCGVTTCAMRRKLRAAGKVQDIAPKEDLQSVAVVRPANEGPGPQERRLSAQSGYGLGPPLPLRDATGLPDDNRSPRGMYLGPGSYPSSPSGSRAVPVPGMLSPGNSARGPGPAPIYRQSSPMQQGFDLPPMPASRYDRSMESQISMQLPAIPAIHYPPQQPPYYPATYVQVPHPQLYHQYSGPVVGFGYIGDPNNPPLPNFPGDWTPASPQGGFVGFSPFQGLGESTRSQQSQQRPRRPEEEAVSVD